MIIAIDGPSGAGKSTIGKSLARALGFLYIDTGAMYRAVGLACLEAGADLSDVEAITEISAQSLVDLSGPPDALQVLLNGRDVSQLIRTDEVSRAASIVSAVSAVRRRLVERQREMGARGNVVMDGRDIGTVVFPQADIKFFLTATPDSRAQRRYLEDLQKGRDATYEATLTDIIERDTRDTTRADSPLKQTDESIVIDSSAMAIEEVLAAMLRVAREKNGSPVV
jgi:cytidylate kinase